MKNNNRKGGAAAALGPIRVTTIAGDGGSVINGHRDGVGTQAQFASPKGIAINAEGQLFVADTYNHTIRKIDRNNNVSTIAGTGIRGYRDDVGTQAQFAYPNGIAINAAGELFVADTNNNRIRKIDIDNNVTTIAGDGTGGYHDGDRTQAQFNRPNGIAINAAGELFVSDNWNNSIRKIEGASTTGGIGFQTAEGRNRRLRLQSAERRRREEEEKVRREEVIRRMDAQLAQIKEKHQRGVYNPKFQARERQVQLYHGNEIPHEFKCPISREIMTDPVVTSDGHTYERSIIEQWFLTTTTSPLTGLQVLNRTSPNTQLPLPNINLNPNHALRNRIETWLEGYNQEMGGGYFDF